MIAYLVPHWRIRFLHDCMKARTTALQKQTEKKKHCYTALVLEVVHAIYIFKLFIFLLPLSSPCTALRRTSSRQKYSKLWLIMQK
jgi:hypothetical protein